MKILFFLLALTIPVSAVNIGDLEDQIKALEALADSVRADSVVGHVNIAIQLDSVAVANGLVAINRPHPRTGRYDRQYVALAFYNVKDPARKWVRNLLVNDYKGLVLNDTLVRLRSDKITVPQRGLLEGVGQLIMDGE